MREQDAAPSVHPSGEATEQALTVSGPSAVDTFGGKVFIRWDPEASVTGFGPVAYFIEFLKTNGLWERWMQALPAALHEPERTGKARHSRDGDAFGIGGPQAIRPHHNRAQRQRVATVAWDEARTQ